MVLFTFNVDPEKVKFASPVNPFAPVAVTTLLFAPLVKVGLPDAVPVKAPTNVVAVATPAMLTLSRFA